MPARTTANLVKGLRTEARRYRSAATQQEEGSQWNGAAGARAAQRSHSRAALFDSAADALESSGSANSQPADAALERMGLPALARIAREHDVRILGVPADSFDEQVRRALHAFYPGATSFGAAGVGV
jgi:hypothetical protein